MMKNRVPRVVHQEFGRGQLLLERMCGCFYFPIANPKRTAGGLSNSVDLGMVIIPLNLYNAYPDFTDIRMPSVYTKVNEGEL